MDWFFCVLENYPTLKRKDGTMVNIIKEEITLEELIRQILLILNHIELLLIILHFLLLIILMKYL